MNRFFSKAGLLLFIATLIFIATGDANFIYLLLCLLGFYIQF